MKFRKKIRQDPILHILSVIVILLCLISIYADFYHILAPYLKESKDTFECGIRDRNFKAIRIIADGMQLIIYTIIVSW